MPTYEQLRSKLKTGDLVLFSGKGGISDLIKLFSGGKWSHVGMIVVIPEFDNAVLLWESTTLSNVADVETSLKVKGVQLVPLSQRVKTYGGEVSVRQLSKPITDEMATSLAEARKALSRKPYERSECELLKAAWDGFLGDSKGEDLSSLFCSELIAEAYQAMELLPEHPAGLPSNEYTPIDFSERRALKLLNGFSLGKEIKVAAS